MNPLYPEHILTLDFAPVHFIDKGSPYNIFGACHRNCEEYCRTTDNRQIFGWLKQTYAEKHRYILHSCIVENDAIINLTPPGYPPTDLFAEDRRILLSTEVTDRFLFLDAITGGELNLHYDFELRANLS